MFKKLLNGIYIAEESPGGCNVYLVAGNPPLLVDLREDDAEKVLESAGRLGKHPSLLVLTHCHYDHSGGAYIAKARGLKVLIGKGDEEVLIKGDDSRSCAVLFGKSLTPVNPDRILLDGDVIESYPYKFTVFITPGHTPGSLCLYEPEKGFLFTGDTIFADGVGRTDLPGGSLAELYKSLKRLSKLDVKALFPGHGQPVVEGAKEVILEALEFLG